MLSWESYPYKASIIKYIDKVFEEPGSPVNNNGIYEVMQTNWVNIFSFKA